VSVALTGQLAPCNGAVYKNVSLNFLDCLIDFYDHCLILMEDIYYSQKKKRVHCFMGRPDLVLMWLKKFLNMYFGVTAAVQLFGRGQIKGLRDIPRNKLLMETDAPGFLLELL
jgi:Tat protein secretion system quality control protein TatD with DNase activity